MFPRCLPLSVSLLVAGLTFAGGTGAPLHAAAASRATALPTADTPIAPAALPTSRVEGRDAAEAAVAATLVDAARRRFAGAPIELRLHAIEMTPASLRDRSVHGRGTLRIGTAPQWVAFHYRALYDTDTATAPWAELTLEDAAAGVAVAGDTATARALQQASVARLRSEFAGQQVRLQFAEVRRLPTAGRYQTVVAKGQVRFDRQPATAARVEALYDTATGRWLALQYELGNAALWPAAAAPQ